MTRPQIPQVNRRRRINVMLSDDAIRAVRENVLPLLPGVHLSDILDGFLQQFAAAIVPIVIAARDAPEHVRAATAESMMAEMFGRIMMDAMRTDGAPKFPPEVNSG